MKEIYGEISYKGVDYKLAFNLNVMERIQDGYGSLSEWGKKTDGQEGEPDIKALIFGFTEMINEGIDIMNEDGAGLEPMTHKQVGRMISSVGLEKAVGILNTTVVRSTEDNEKNA